MNEPPVDAVSDRYAATLVVRRIIRATPEKLFAAWTEPEQLIHWWGPDGVSCPSAEIDLRPGGSYRIANRFPDGTLVWISGVFELVEPPHRLIYTWRLEAASASIERVSVNFEPRDSGTEVVVTHERIGSAAARTTHERGWSGCLDGLARYAQSF
jgi:uncharacterized protein YndB with AHSA1/START domain